MIPYVTSSNHSCKANGKSWEYHCVYTTVANSFCSYLWGCLQGLCSPGDFSPACLRQEIHLWKCRRQHFNPLGRSTSPISIKRPSYQKAGEKGGSCSLRKTSESEAVFSTCLYQVTFHWQGKTVGLFFYMGIGETQLAPAARQWQIVKPVPHSCLLAMWDSGT